MRPTRFRQPLRLGVEQFDARCLPSVAVGDPADFRLASTTGYPLEVPVLTLPTRAVDGPFVAIPAEVAAGRTAAVDWGDGRITAATFAPTAFGLAAVGTTRELAAGTTYQVAVRLTDTDAPDDVVTIRFEVATAADASSGRQVVVGYQTIDDPVTTSLNGVPFALARFAAAATGGDSATPAPVIPPAGMTPPDTSPPVTTQQPGPSPANPYHAPPPPPPISPPPAPALQVPLPFSPIPPAPALPPPASGSPFQAGAVQAMLQRPVETPTHSLVTRPVSADARVGWSPSDRPGFAFGSPGAVIAAGGPGTRFLTAESRRGEARDVGRSPSAMATWPVGRVDIGVEADGPSRERSERTYPVGASRVTAPDRRRGRTPVVAPPSAVEPPPVLHGVMLTSDDSIQPASGGPDPAQVVLASYLDAPAADAVFLGAPPAAERPTAGLSWPKFALLIASAVGAGARAATPARDHRGPSLEPTPPGC